MVTPASGPASDDQPEERLRRRTDRRLVAGVCAGFAEHFAVPPWRVRALCVLAIVATLGLALIAYALLAWLLPTAGAAPDDGGDPRTDGAR